MVKQHKQIQPPKPVPPQACSGDEAKARMAAANAKPIDFAQLAAEPWQHVGGSAGFAWNGYPINPPRRPNDDHDRRRRRESADERRR